MPGGDGPILGGLGAGGEGLILETRHLGFQFGLTGRSPGRRLCGDGEVCGIDWRRRRTRRFRPSQPIFGQPIEQLVVRFIVAVLDVVSAKLFYEIAVLVLTFAALHLALLVGE